MKKTFVILLGVSMLLLAACSPQPLQTIGAAKYYVNIANDGEVYEDSGYERYEYVMTGYDKEGESLELTFSARKQLKHGAYLMIYYKNDKVITYEEVDFENIPVDAQAQLKSIK